MTGHVVTVVMTTSVVMISEAGGVDEEAADDSGVETAGLVTGLDWTGVLVLAAAVLPGVVAGVV